MSNFRISFSHPWLLLLLIPAVVLTLIPYFRANKKYRRNRNRIISITLHMLVMTLCVTLIAGITFLYQTPNKGNELILLVDASYSGSEKQDEKDEFIQSVIDECSNEFKIGIVKFGYGQLYAAQLSDDAKEVYKKYLDSDEPDTSATDVASALKYAQTLFTNPQAGKIVLISDGIETDGSASSVIKSIAAEGIKVDTVYFPNEEHDEVQIIGVKMPDYTVDVGAKFNIELTLQSNLKGGDNGVSVTVYDNGKAGKTTEYKLTGGVETLKTEHAFELPGLHELRIEIACANDTLSQNNSYYSYVYLEDYENILIIEKDKNEAENLKNLLEVNYQVTVLSVEEDADEIPADLAELCEYKQVILVNVANSDMPAGFDELLYDYVYNVGGGLFTVGGNNDVVDGKLVPHAYNRNDMLSGSQLYQQMLPVQVIEYTPPVAVMIIVDHSGSMGSGENSPMYFAKQGAMAVFDVLNPRDYCGVMTLDDDPTEIIRVTPVSQKEVIRDAINGITNEGDNGTVYTTAIQRAGASLAGVNVEKRHIILVTDGQPGDSTEFGEAIEINAKNGITMSIVSIGTDGDLELMQASAELGNGNFYNPTEVEEIAVDIKADLNSEAVAEIAYGDAFIPRIKDHTPAVAGIAQEDMPALYGYYGTRAKANADVPLTGEHVPIYAQWKYGAGSVGSFMSDLNGNWSSEFITSPTGQRFINNVVSGLFPTKDIRQSDIKTVLREDNYTNALNVYTKLEEGESIEVKVNPVTEAANDFYSQNPIAVAASDGYTRFTFSVTFPGLYEITVERKSVSGEVLSQLTVYKTLSYSEEYDFFPDVQPVGEEYLADLAEKGKGVAVEDLYDVFDSFERTQNKSYDPRLLFLILAIIFFLLDVAVRKFKFKWPHELIRDYREKKSLTRDKN